MSILIVAVVALIVGAGLGYGYRGWFHKQIGSAGKIVEQTKEKL